ncbi:MAG: chemotaxis protein CheA [Bdellovibrionaceae bacterium]|nr:chemotaxis protein CheA [Bdellovibrio sp.]
MDIPAELLRELQEQFIDEIGFMLDDCEESFLKLQTEDKRPDELTKIFRLAHCIKGSAASIGLNAVAEFSHSLEDCLTILRARPKAVTPAIISLLLRVNDELRNYLSLLREEKQESWNADRLKIEITNAIHSLNSSSSVEEITLAPANEFESVNSNTSEVQARSEQNAVHSNNSIKLEVSRLERVLNLVGELVVIKSQVLETFGDTSSNHTVENDLLSLFEKTIRELQDQTMTMRLSAIKPAFMRVQRIIRETSLKLNKPIEVVIEGEDVEVDRAMVDLLIDPLLHIVRNALDHGIENTEQRILAGKKKSGLIRLAARQAGARIIVEIADDGAGIVNEKVFKRATERGLVADGIKIEQLTNADIYEYLFMPGFSTADAVTELSGRGVGLDVARSNIQRLKGTINLVSVPGQGTTFSIVLPLTTAITDGIVAVIEGLRVVVPIDSVLEIADLREKDLIQLDEKNQIIKIREKLIPIFKVNEFLRHSAQNIENIQTPHGRNGEDENHNIVFILKSDTTAFGLLVSNIIGQSQVLVKPLGPAFADENGLSGVAILGDGKVGLVLDVEMLSRLVRRRDEQFEVQIA